MPLTISCIVNALKSKENLTEKGQELWHKAKTFLYEKNGF